MLDLCYLWYSCDTAWDICVIMWWMCHIYVTLVWNVYMFFLWRWMWLIHKNRKHIKKQQQFAECFYPDTRQSNHFSISWKTYLPSVITLALGEVSNFAECQKTGTRQRPKLRRVPDAWHSAKTQTSPSAARLALGEVWIFAECREYGTRQSFRPVPFGRPVRQFAVPFASSPVRPSRFNFFAECGLAHGKGLPSAREKALCKAGFAGRRKAVCASPSATLGKEVAECFSAFAECLWHSAKYASPVVLPACLAIG